MMNGYPDLSGMGFNPKQESIRDILKKVADLSPDEILATFEIYEKAVDEIIARRQPPEIDLSPWVPERGAMFFIIRQSGEVGNWVAVDVSGTDFLSSGNCFPTEQQAQDDASYTKARRRYEAMCRVVNGGTLLPDCPQAIWFVSKATVMSQPRTFFEVHGIRCGVTNYSDAQRIRQQLITEGLLQFLFPGATT